MGNSHISAQLARNKIGQIADLSVRQVVFLASPHANGVTDRLGKAAASANATIIALRDYAIRPCCGCGFCQIEEYCRFADAAASLLKLLARAESLIIAAPIYFYALPAHFKALIDRSQIFWRHGRPNWPCGKKAGIILAAGRPRGARLFAGSLLTLKYFLKPFAFRIEQTLLLRGLETVDNLTKQHEQDACALGQAIFSKPAYQ